MAFRNKINYVLEYKPDILVIQESEELDKFSNTILLEFPNRIWVGDNKNKGVLVLSRNGYSLEQIKSEVDDFKYIIPIKVTSTDMNFYLFAVWAQYDKDDSSMQYIGQVWLAINKYSELLSKDVILIGDFNSNSIWDMGNKKIINHSKFVAFLNEKDIKSIYHLKHNENHGEETIKTLAFRKNLKMQYHIDYCFASKKICESANITIEKFGRWIDKSDHVPIIIDYTKS